MKPWNLIDVSAKFTRIDATIRRSRRRRRLTVRTIRLRESKKQRVWRLREITERPATPDLRDFQRYLSKEGTAFVIARSFERPGCSLISARNVRRFPSATTQRRAAFAAFALSSGIARGTAFLDYSYYTPRLSPAALTRLAPASVAR